MLVILGPLAGQASGRLGSVVASRNRAGAYFRNGSIPVTSTTPFALAAKSRLAQVSQAWQLLTEAQRAAWAQWAQTNPSKNRLGQAITLTGHAAYVGINSRILLMEQSLLDAPPILPAPAPLNTMVLSADIGSGTFDLTITPTPLGATEKIMLRAAYADSPGVNYISNSLRFCGFTAAAAASPVDIQSEIEARIGAAVEGMTLHVWAAVADTATGQISQWVRDRALVTDTP